MKTLEIRTQNIVGLGDVPKITAYLTPVGEPPMHMCNAFADLEQAMEEGVPFVAHKIRAMKPVELIVNPAHVATIEEALP
jgi:hypothetical protein